MNEFNISTFSQLKDACVHISSIYTSPQCFALHGHLGSGKTTFVKTFVELFDQEITTNSPTYSIVNEYSIKNQLILHYDLYRLNTIFEAYDIGIEEYLDRDAFHFLEWPEIIDEILPSNTVHLKFNSSNFERKLIIE